MFPPDHVGRGDGPHRVGRPRHVASSSSAAGTPASRGPTTAPVASTAGSPSTPSSPSTARPPAPPLLRTAAGPDRHPGPRHHEQLRRRHDAVGHGAVGRGELQPVLLSPPAPTAEEKRYGLGAQDAPPAGARVDERWDAVKNPNEPNRFGWIVEVDPEDPRSTPVKHTAMGRFKHEGANVIVNGDGKVVAYMGDDERFDYVYRFVSRDTYRAGGSKRDRAHNKTLLSARRPLGRPLHRRRPRGRRQRRHRRVAAADRRRRVGRARHDHRAGARLHAPGRRQGPAHQDGPPRGRRAQLRQRVHLRRVHQQHRPRQGRQGGPDRAQPAQRQQGRPRRRDDADRRRPHGRRPSRGTSSSSAATRPRRGHLLRRLDRTGVADLLPRQRRLRLGRQPVGLHRRPAERDQEVNDGLFKVPVAGPGARTGAAVPRRADRAETCGPVIHDRDGSVFVAVQHPGEDGSWAAQQSYFPDFVGAGGTPRRGQFAGPRPTVVQVTRR